MGVGGGIDEQAVKFSPVFADKVHDFAFVVGLFDGQAYTLEEVGRKMGVTRERVRQIEAQALSRLRHPAIRRKLREYLG